jgi:N-dimethylarginine dimethylaminohydrolase
VINQTVLMSSAEFFSNEQPINPYYHAEPIDIHRAVDEHRHIKKLLEQAGVRVVPASAPSDSQDGVYTANWALVRNGKAVMSRLPQARKTEEAHAKVTLENLGIQTIVLPEELKFSGQGDALPCGDMLFAGSHYRSDPEAQAIVAKELGFQLIQLQTTPQLDEQGNPVTNWSSGWADSFFYDIDLALAILRGPKNGQKGLIAYCPEAFTPESQAILAELDAVDTITVSLEEATKGFACNLVSTGDTVVMSAHAPEFSATLQNLGFTVLTPEISELAKGGGYIRCTTLTLG